LSYYVVVTNYNTMIPYDAFVSLCRIVA